MPATVILPCGAISTTRSPTRTCMARARSTPRATLKLPGASVSRLPARIFWPMSATPFSAAGTMPRISAPRTESPLESMACEST